MRHRKTTFMAVMAGTLALAACEGGTGTGSGNGSVTVRLFDAPGDLASATVQISEIYLQGSTAADSLSHKVVLYSGNGTFDLLTLSGGTTVDLVKDVAVPAGTYSQMRFVVTSATVKTRAGATFSTADGTLKCPSCAQSGLKVNLPGGGVKVTDGGNVVGVDFDVAQSFGREAGNSGKWVMHPVITASTFTLSGGISGTVAAATGVALPTCGGAATDLTKFVPQATADGITRSGTTAAGGAYTIPFVAPGASTMGYASTVGFANGDTLTYAATPTPPTVTVASGQTATGANYSITAASCKPHT
jgi:hypothetical protein